MSVLHIDHVSMQFGGVKAVTDLTFAMAEGEVLSIIGPNGAGKTTVFNLVSRFYDASEGSLRFGNHDLARLAPHDVPRIGIARTFQNIELFGRATVLENLLIGRHCKDQVPLWQQLLYRPRANASELAHRRFAEEIIDFLDLHTYRDQMIANLPYGVRKVVELGRALCVEPKLLLLDEPSSGLNPEETDDMGYWIEDIRDQLGISVLMIEHDMRLVAQVSDRVLALNYGKTIACDKPDTVLRHPEVVEAYLGGVKA